MKQKFGNSALSDIYRVIDFAIRLKIFSLLEITLSLTPNLNFSRKE